jgi:hypothetical protein
MRSGWLARTAYFLGFRFWALGARALGLRVREILSTHGLNKLLLRFAYSSPKINLTISADMKPNAGKFRDGTLL